MKQTTYMCPVCQNDEKPLKKTSMSRQRCLICDRSFYNKELLGFEIGRTDFVEYWKERKKALNSQLSYPIVDGIERSKDVDSQMNNMVQESTDNLMHEIIMICAYNKNLLEKEEEDEAIEPEIVEIKDDIDKLFDVVLGRA